VSKRRIEGAGFSGVGSTVHGWIAALRGIRDNPLVLYWCRAEQRRQEGKHWFKRSPGLFSLAVVIALGVSTYLSILLYRLASAPGGLLTALSGRVWLVGGTEIFLYGISLFAMCWLTARVYTACSIALGFLEANPRRRFREVLDDMLAITTLSPQEILLAVASYCLRHILPPLLLLSASFVTIIAIFGFTSGVEPFWYGPPLDITGQELSAVLRYLVSFAQIVVSGSLGMLILIFMYLTLGLLPRSGPLPQLGAGLQAAFQLVLTIVGGVVLVTAFDGLTRSIAGYEQAIQILLLVIVLTSLFFYLARRNPGLQRLMGYGLPIFLGSIGFIIYTVIALKNNCFFRPDSLLTEGLWAMGNLTVFNPAHLLPAVSLFSYPHNAPEFLFETWRYPSSVVCQVVLLLIMAEFARDSVRRRFQGVSGT